MTPARTWIRATWPFGLLLAFAVVGRSTPEQVGAASPRIDCTPRLEASIEQLAACVALNPEDAEALVSLGTAYEGAHADERAEEAYRRAIRIDPEGGLARLRLGALLLRRGDTRGAAEQVALATSLLPGSAQAAALAAQTGVTASRSGP